MCWKVKATNLGLFTLLLGLYSQIKWCFEEVLNTLTISFKIKIE